MINDRDKTDDLFRKSLADMKVEPSAGLWEKIEFRFFTGMGGSWFSGRILLIGIIFLFSGLIAWLTLPGSNQELVPLNSSSQEQVLNNKNIYPDPIIGAKVASENETPDMFSSHSGNNTQAETQLKKPSALNTYTKELPGKAQPGSTDSQATHKNTIDSQANISSAGQESDQTEFASDTYPENPVSAGNSGLLPSTTVSTDRSGLAMIGQLEAIRSGILKSLPVRPASLKPRDASMAHSFSPTFEDTYAEKADLRIGAHISPGIIYYDPNPNRNVYSADLSLNYYLPGGLSLHSGIGLTRMEDIGNYKVNYQSYDSVGYFLNVTSFSVDPLNQERIIMNYKKQIVYDSLNHFSLTEKVNTYTYLDIPLSIAYNFWEKRRLSLGLKAGVIYSLLLSKNEPTVEFSGPTSELISIDRKVPTRSKSTWRFTASIDLGYMLTDKISFHLEPVFEQYIKSVYAKDPAYNARNPFITGIRAGILFNF